MRVLHLIDGHSPQASATTLAMLADAQDRLKDCEQSIVLLGGEALGHAARHAGIRRARRIAVPFGRAPLGWLAMHARIRRGDLANVDVIHCWSLGAFTLATTLFCRTPRLLTLTTIPDKREIHWLAAACREAGAGVAILTTSATIRREAISGGVPEPAVHVLRPSIDMARMDHHGRDARRQSWELSDPNAAVVALLSDPPRAADAMSAALAVSLAITAAGNAGRRIHLLVHPDQRNRVRAATRFVPLGRHDAVIADHDAACPWRTLPACDVALAMGDAGAGLSMLWAMAAGVPIIAEARYATSEIIEDRHSALLTRPGKTPAIAERLTQLLADRQLAWKIRDAARNEAYSYFSRQRYCQSLTTVYESFAAGNPIEIPPMEPTGGLRFMGRV